MRKYYSDLGRLHHAFPPSYDRDVPGLVDNLEEERVSMETIIHTATQMPRHFVLFAAEDSGHATPLQEADNRGEILTLMRAATVAVCAYERAPLVLESLVGGGTLWIWSYRALGWSSGQSTIGIQERS